MSNPSKSAFCAASIVLATAVCVSSTGCSESEAMSHGGEAHEAEHKIVVTSPVERDVVSTQEYVCQIHSCRHIEVCGA